MYIQQVLWVCHRSHLQSTLYHLPPPLPQPPCHTSLTPPPRPAPPRPSTDQPWQTSLPSPPPRCRPHCPRHHPRLGVDVTKVRPSHVTYAVTSEAVAPQRSAQGRWSTLPRAPPPPEPPPPHEPARPQRGRTKKRGDKRPLTHMYNDDFSGMFLRHQTILVFGLSK